MKNGIKEVKDALPQANSTAPINTHCYLLKIAKPPQFVTYVQPQKMPPPLNLDDYKAAETDIDIPPPEWGDA